MVHEVETHAGYQSLTLLTWLTEAIHAVAMVTINYTNDIFLRLL